MKKRILYMAVGFVLSIVSTSEAQILFIANLNGSQEPSNPTTIGVGTFWGVLSSDMKTLTYRVTYAQLTSPFTASHFHSGAPGINGGVVQPITFSGNTANGVWQSLPDSIVRSLLRGNIYVNIHTQMNPGGEIRGQLTAVQGAGFTISLNGSQETPPTGSTSTGTGYVVLDSLGSRLWYAATIAGLSGTFTASHFHEGAVGVAGGVVQPLTFLDSSMSGTWSGIPDNILTDVVTGNLYMNVHSTVNPGGEIRGQVLYQGGASGLAGIDNGKANSPTRFSLNQNYPNPFNPTTVISFSLPTSQRVSLKIFNILGNEIVTLVDGIEPMGQTNISFDASHVASGIYFYRLTTASGVQQTRKMIVLK